MTKKILTRFLLLGIGALLLAGLLYQIPRLNRRLSWRVDIALTYLRGVIYPAEAVPTPRAQIITPPITLTPSLTLTPTLTLEPNNTAILTLTNTPEPTPIPQQVYLAATGWEQQDWNNCGPATLSMYLHYYGWEGDQFSVSNLLKPDRTDRNVNVEELAYYARNYAGWLETQYRVNGDIELLKEFVAAEIPVMIESSFYFAGAYWPNDDLWAAHYLLVSGYDDGAGVFTVQDSYHGRDETLDYETLDEYWQPFNRLYILIFDPTQEDAVRSILGSAWDEETSRELALETNQAALEEDSDDAFSWFNLGTNLLYFERYAEAAQAYDQARTLGLPQRMMRYQFGPFFAYFHSERIDELLTLTEYALQRTPNSEEALLWHGWGLYRQGDINGAITNFRSALKVNPNNLDAQYALDFMTN